MFLYLVIYIFRTIIKYSAIFLCFCYYISSKRYIKIQNEEVIYVRLKRFCHLRRKRPDH